MRIYNKFKNVLKNLYLMIIPSAKVREAIAFYGGVAGALITFIGILWGVFNYVETAKEIKQTSIDNKHELIIIKNQNQKILVGLKFNNENISGIKKVLEIHVNNTKDEINYWKYIPNNQNNPFDDSYIIIPFDDRYKNIQLNDTNLICKK